jgi:hypothetical protein
VEQFKGKPNIEVFQKALARQLEDLYSLFYQLNTLRHLQNAEGVQLDGIGDIVALTRQDAFVVSRLADHEVPMDDPTYRLYLAWKIFLNTTNCTYEDVHRAITMFWDKTPLLYSEEVDLPATIIFSTPVQDPSEVPHDLSVLALVPIIKAAGVGILLRSPSDVFQFINKFRLDFINMTSEFILDPNTNDLTFEDFAVAVRVLNQQTIYFGARFDGAVQFDGSVPFSSMQLTTLKGTEFEQFDVGGFEFRNNNTVTMGQSFKFEIPNNLPPTPQLMSLCMYQFEQQNSNAVELEVGFAFILENFGRYTWGAKFDGEYDFDGSTQFNGYDAEIFKGTEFKNVRFGFTLNSSEGFHMEGTLTRDGYTPFNGSIAFNSSQSFGKINITEVL